MSVMNKICARITGLRLGNSLIFWGISGLSAIVKTPSGVASSGQV